MIADSRLWLLFGRLKFSNKWLGLRIFLDFLSRCLLRRAVGNCPKLLFGRLLEPCLLGILFGWSNFFNRGLRLNFPHCLGLHHRLRTSAIFLIYCCLLVSRHSLGNEAWGIAKAGLCVLLWLRVNHARRHNLMDWWMLALNCSLWEVLRLLYRDELTVLKHKHASFGQRWRSEHGCCSNSLILQMWKWISFISHKVDIDLMTGDLTGTRFIWALAQACSASVDAMRQLNSTWVEVCGIWVAYVSRLLSFSCLIWLLKHNWTSPVWEIFSSLLLLPRWCFVLCIY